MTAQTHLLTRTERYAIHSTLEGPMVVDAENRERALYLGLMLLERTHRIENLAFEYTEDGTLFATDVDSNEHFAVRMKRAARVELAA